MKAAYIRQQQLIRSTKLHFTDMLCQQLELILVQAPLLSEQGSGVQDDLSGAEQAVTVNVKALPGRQFEVVHSLAKWKRQTLARYGFSVGEGIVTDMRALRPDEDELGAKHSVYVDQWDWEKVIADEQRSVDFLQQSVNRIYKALQQTENRITKLTGLTPQLADSVYFIDSETLAQRYPTLTPKQREKEITRQQGSVFIIGIGARLSNGHPHDLRAPDYDDWSTVNTNGISGLNGDLLVWNPQLQDALELSSMGIRVDATALQRQLKLSQQEHRAHQPWHQALLAGKLPLSIGGGIGQSRVVMQLLQLDHIAQVHCGVWPENVQHAL